MTVDKGRDELTRPREVVLDMSSGGIVREYEAGDGGML